MTFGRNIFSSFSFRKNSLECSRTRISVVKTIRLKLSCAEFWLGRQQNMKVGISPGSDLLSQCFADRAPDSRPSSPGPVSDEEIQ